MIDTPGFGDYTNNRDSWMPIIDFIDDQHESYMRQEQQPKRQELIDMRVHCCLYFIRPTGHTLKPLDIEIMKRLGTRVNLIPVIAKADTITPTDLHRFKKRVSRLGSGAEDLCSAPPFFVILSPASLISRKTTYAEEAAVCSLGSLLKRKERKGN